jgi:ubiquinone/menaquinone biosynthesis C-methylase UbiE
MTSREEVTDAYDALAEGYEDTAEQQAHNAHLKFPAMTGLVPDVEGARVLDAGCGAGRYAEWLLEAGADRVVGCDVSAEMVATARERLGEVATVHHADVAEPLDFLEAGAVDGVVCSGVLDYVADWRDPLGEFARVLTPGGFLVFSVGHPFSAGSREDCECYFDVERRPPDFEAGAPFYRRPLEEILGPLLSAGFRLEAVVEPEPTEQFREQAPEAYEEFSQEPTFLCLRATLE